MNLIFKCVALSLGAALFLEPSTAVGQPRPLPISANAEDKTASEMRASFLEGYAHQKAGRWAEAERAYGSAWSKKKTHDVAANLGLVSMELKKYVQAADCFAFALRNYPAGGSPGKRTDMEQSLQQASAQVGRLLFTVNIEGSTIIVNGIDRGRSPLDGPVFIEPGAYTIEVRHPGYVVDQRSGSIEKGKSVTASVTLSAEKLVPPMPTVTASAAPSASVSATASPVPPQGPRKEIVIGGAAVAGVALVAGAIFAGLAGSKAGDADGKGGWDPCYAAPRPPASANCSELDGLRRDSATFTNAAAWSFIGGAAVGGATLVYALVMRSPKAEPLPMQATPVISEHGGGLLLLGNF